MKKKTLAVIGCVGIPSKYGGFETVAEYLTKQISDEYDLTVYCSACAYPGERQDRFMGARLRYIHLKANGIQSILYDAVSMLDACFRGTDVFLILGVSGCLFLPVLRFFGCRRRIVTNIDGMEWRRNKWKYAARCFLKLSENAAVCYSDSVIGDNKIITDYIESEYGKKGILIEYGADHVFPVSPTPELLQEFPETKDPYCFGVCRIEPENNVQMILEAFQSSTQTLLMVGNWGNSEYGRMLLEKYASSPNIHLLGPIYDERKLNYLRGNCRLYMHGHSCGGTNPSLIEAMMLGRPIAAYDVNFNRETMENRSFYFQTPDDIRPILALKESELAEEGCIMSEIANRRYTWERIAKLYCRSFN